jgi:hypothetical protein
MYGINPPEKEERQINNQPFVSMENKQPPKGSKNILDQNLSIANRLSNIEKALDKLEQQVNSIMINLGMK